MVRAIWFKAFLFLKLFKVGLKVLGLLVKSFFVSRAF